MSTGRRREEEVEEVEVEEEAGEREGREAGNGE